MHVSGGAGAVGILVLRGVRVIRRLLLASVVAGVGVMSLAVGFADAARSADLPVARAPAYYPGVVTPVPYYDWGGVYIGLNAGSAWLSQNAGTITNSTTGAFVATSQSLASRGFAGGGQIGANWFIAPSFVLGVEADFDELTNSTTVTSLDGSNQHANKLKFLSTARGRFGLTADRFMFYFTGGFAWGENSVTRTQIGAPLAGTTVVGTSETVNNFRLGWVVGTGIEYAIASSWTARAEYLYARLGDVTYTFPIAQRTTQTPLEAINLVRVGVNYKFGGGDPYIHTRD
jgi:outer membrane immunogenic protein